MSTGNEALDLVRAMTQLLREVDYRQSLDQTLNVLMHGAVQLFPEVDQAAVSVTHRRGQVDGLAETGPIGRRLNEVEQWLGEGPGFAALRGGGVISTQDGSGDDRWPRYSRAAADLGVRAQLSIPLIVRKQFVTTMALYCTKSQTIGAATTIVAEAYGEQVGVVLGRAQSEEQWARAVQTRQLIGQATGILMERKGMTADAAFAYLTRISSTTNVTVRDIARQLVAGVEEAQV